MNGIQEAANIWNKFDGVNIEKSFNDNKHIWFQLGSRDEMGLKLMENTRFYYKGGVYVRIMKTQRGIRQLWILMSLLKSSRIWI